MNGKIGMARWAITTVLFLCSLCLPASGAESFVTRTNWVEKTITNVIEVSMPKNVFVNAYRTNVIQQFRTNFFDRTTTNVVKLYVTNQIKRTVTNNLVLEAYRTNVITAHRTNVVETYRTNIQTNVRTNEVAVQLYRTNVVDRYHTNLKTFTFTNEVAVDTFRTNFVERYRTNVKVLTFTNWETVVAMRTNWVNQRLTNFVQVDVPANKASAAPGPGLKETPAAGAGSNEISGRSGSTILSDSLVLDAERVGRPSANNLIDVVVKVHWAGDISDAPKVQQWRIEREDGAFLSFGQDQDLRKQVSVGTYKLEVKVLREFDNTLLVTRGTLIVTANNVAVQQKSTGKRVAAAGL